MEQVLIGLAILIHVYIFVMESLLWGRPRTNKAFGMSDEAAEQNRVFAFNQGFYNLFLAIGAVVGIVMDLAPLKIFCCASMCGAALVLIYSQPKLWRAALVQGLPPFLALFAIFLSST